MLVREEQLRGLSDSMDTLAVDWNVRMESLDGRLNNTDMALNSKATLEALKQLNSRLDEFEAGQVASKNELHTTIQKDLRGLMVGRPTKGDLQNETEARQVLANDLNFKLQTFQMELAKQAQKIHLENVERNVLANYVHTMQCGGMPTGGLREMATAGPRPEETLMQSSRQ